MYKYCAQQIQPIHFTGPGNGWHEITGDEPLGYWFITQDYNVHLMVQQACKLLQRMNRPQTVKEFLLIDPAQYMGLWGIGKLRYPLLLNLRMQFLDAHQHLDDIYATHD